VYIVERIRLLQRLGGHSRWTAASDQATMADAARMTNGNRRVSFRAKIRRHPRTPGGRSHDIGEIALEMDPSGMRLRSPMW